MTMPAPFVSIITPTYNHERFIADCIDSALAQSYPHWEMIIIDDGSADKTPDIIKSFTDPRIKYTRQAHQGGGRLGAIYNNALEQSAGEFIAILEGDDFWPPDKLTVQLAAFSAPDMVLSYGDCVLTNEKGRKLFRRRIPADKNIAGNDPVGAALRRLSGAGNFIYAQTVMIRKSALDKIGGFIQPEYLHLVDYPTWCRLALEGRFQPVPQVLGYWRRNINSLTMSESSMNSDGFVRYIKEFTRTYKEQIAGCGLHIDIAGLGRQREARLARARKYRDYSRAVTALIYGYNKTARRYFKSCLKQPDAPLFYKAAAAAGILLSYTPVLNIFLAWFGRALSGPLSFLKKRLLSPRG